jgi:hypothetical protein
LTIIDPRAENGFDVPDSLLNMKNDMQAIDLLNRFADQDEVALFEGADFRDAIGAVKIRGEVIEQSFNGIPYSIYVSKLDFVDENGNIVDKADIIFNPDYVGPTGKGDFSDWEFLKDTDDLPIDFDLVPRDLG